MEPSPFPIQWHRAVRVISDFSVEIRNIIKTYGDFVAVNDVDLTVRSGEILGLMGENGAGKSTLMNVLYGLTKATEGMVLINGNQVDFDGPLDAVDAGLGMVHQSFKLFNELTVWENLVFQNEPRSGIKLDRAAARKAVIELSRRYNLDVPPDARVKDLPVGIRQRLEILKALHNDAKLLIMDEPTAVLTPQQRDGLFDALRGLAKQGMAIIIVTHKMHEVMALTDRVTVLRDGENVAELVTSETSDTEIIKAMTGRHVKLVAEKDELPAGDVCLKVRGLGLEENGRRLLRNISFDVRAHEVVGIAGVSGNGQIELAECLSGMKQVSMGSIVLNGQDITHFSVKQTRDAGFAHIAEDRHHTATAEDASIGENLVFGSHINPPFSRWGLLNYREIHALAERLIKAFGIRCGSDRVSVGSLSGGNMQKVVVARELNYHTPFILAVEPTRGVDVGAIEFIHKEFLDRRNEGKALLVISSELTELISLCDRVLVMFEGEIVADLTGDELDEFTIGAFMIGKKAA